MKNEELISLVREMFCRFCDESRKSSNVKVSLDDFLKQSGRWGFSQISQETKNRYLRTVLNYLGTKSKQPSRSYYIDSGEKIITVEILSTGYRDHIWVRLYYVQNDPFSEKLFFDLAITSEALTCEGDYIVQTVENSNNITR